MTVDVELHAFESGGMIRPVDLPDDLLYEEPADVLPWVWYYGQNDHQPKPYRSISVGDIIRLGDRRFIIRAIGFESVADDYHPTEPDWLMFSPKTRCTKAMNKPGPLPSGCATWVAAGIIGLGLVLLWSAMPVAWRPPVWPTKTVQVVIPFVVDALPLEGIHTVEFTAPANTTVIRAEIDGHVQSVNIPGGMPGRVVFSFPGSHAHRYAAIVLQTSEGIRRVETLLTTPG